MSKDDFSTTKKKKSEEKKKGFGRTENATKKKSLGGGA